MNKISSIDFTEEFIYEYASQLPVGVVGYNNPTLYVTSCTERPFSEDKIKMLSRKGIFITRDQHLNFKSEFKVELPKYLQDKFYEFLEECKTYLKENISE